MKIRNFILASMAVVGAVWLTSCSDDETYDVVGNPNNLVFAPDASGIYGVVQTPVGAFGGMEADMVARCNKTASGEIKVTFAIDNALIEEYNTQHATEYLPVPEGAVSIENAVVTIAPGTRESADTAVVKLVEDDAVLASLTDKKGYLVPVKLSEATGAALASSVKSVSYLIINVSEELVDENATEGTRKGSLVDDRSGWTVTGLDGTETSTDWYGNGGDPAAWFDGDRDNSCIFTNSSGPAVVVVDLGKEYKVDGIIGKYRLYSYYDAGVFQSAMKVYYSSDNRTWNDMTEIGSTGWTGKDFIGLYGPVPMRYIKLELPKTSSWSDPEIQCGDFNVYASN